MKTICYNQKKSLFTFGVSGKFTIIENNKERSMWQFERKEKWFESMWNNKHCPHYQKKWRQYFHMSGLNFEKLVSLVQMSLKRQGTNLRKYIPVEKRVQKQPSEGVLKKRSSENILLCVAVALWRLVMGNFFRSAAKTFTAGKSTSCLSLIESIFNSLLVYLFY